MYIPKQYILFFLSSLFIISLQSMQKEESLSEPLIITPAYSELVMESGVYPDLLAIIKIEQELEDMLRAHELVKLTEKHVNEPRFTQNWQDVLSADYHMTEGFFENRKDFMKFVQKFCLTYDTLFPADSDTFMYHSHNVYKTMETMSRQSEQFANVCKKYVELKKAAIIGKSAKRAALDIFLTDRHITTPTAGLMTEAESYIRNTDQITAVKKALVFFNNAPSLGKYKKIKNLLKEFTLEKFTETLIKRDILIDNIIDTQPLPAENLQVIERPTIKKVISDLSEHLKELSLTPQPSANYQIKDDFIPRELLNKKSHNSTTSQKKSSKKRSRRHGKKPKNAVNIPPASKKTAQDKFAILTQLWNKHMPLAFKEKDALATIGSGFISFKEYNNLTIFDMNNVLGKYTTSKDIKEYIETQIKTPIKFDYRVQLWYDNSYMKNIEHAKKEYPQYQNKDEVIASHTPPKAIVEIFRGLGKLRQHVDTEGKYLEVLRWYGMDKDGLIKIEATLDDKSTLFHYNKLSSSNFANE